MSPKGSKNRQIENCLLALWRWSELPSKRRVNLETWDSSCNPWGHRKEKHCGAVHCLGGWVATWPEFQKQGIQRSDFDGSPYADGMSSWGVAEKFFGQQELFSSRLGMKEDDRANNDYDRAVERLQSTIEKLS